MIGRVVFLWVLVTTLVYLFALILSTPAQRRQAINGRTVKQSTFFVIAGIVAALVVAFIQAAQKFI